MATEAKPANIQDQFLNRLRKEKQSVTVHIVNGYQLNHIRITGYDAFVIMAESAGKPIMIYKHAISTITPENAEAKE